jgi:flavin-dependent dehydrogenase
VRYQGNWIPHKLRPAVDRDVFFAGDSAGHCLPLTAEGIRTAFYFGIALGRELRAVVEGRTPRDAAVRRYAAFSAEHEWKFEWMLRAQRFVPAVPPLLLTLATRAMASRRFTHWAFDHYLRIAPPGFATPRPATTASEHLIAA